MSGMRAVGIAFYDVLAVPRDNADQAYHLRYCEVLARALGGSVDRVLEAFVSFDAYIDSCPGRFGTTHEGRVVLGAETSSFVRHQLMAYMYVFGTCGSVAAEAFNYAAVHTAARSARTLNISVEAKEFVTRLCKRGVAVAIITDDDERDTFELIQQTFDADVCLRLERFFIGGAERTVIDAHGTTPGSPRIRNYLGLPRVVFPHRGHYVRRWMNFLEMAVAPADSAVLIDHSFESGHAPLVASGVLGHAWLFQKVDHPAWEIDAVRECRHGRVVTSFEEMARWVE